MSNLKRVALKSRRSLFRKSENESAKKRKRQRAMNDSMHTYLNAHKTRTLFSNYRHCVVCSCNLVSAEEITERSDIVASGVVSLAGNDEARRMGKYWICKYCDENDLFPIRQSNLNSFHMVLSDTDVGPTFIPVLEQTRELAVNQQTLGSFETRKAFMVFPISISSLGSFDKDTKLCSLSAIDMQRLVYGSPQIENSAASLLYENALVKYWRAKFNSDFFTGSIQNVANKKLNSVKQLSKDREIAGSLAWRRSNKEDQAWKMWQFGPNCLKIELKFKPGLQSVVTELVQQGTVISASLSGDATEEQKVKYLVHLTHNNETLCKDDCIKVPLSTYLEDNQVAVSSSTFLSSVDLTANSIITNIIKSPASFLESQDYHFSFSFDAEGNITLEGLIWPNVTRNLNLALCEYPVDEVKVKELRDGMLHLLKSNISTSGRPEILSKQLSIDGMELQESVKLVNKFQLHDPMSTRIVNLPSLEWTLKESNEEDAANIEPGSLLIRTVKQLLLSLPTEKIKSMSTSDWLQELWKEVQDSEIVDPNIWLFKFQDISFVFEITEKLSQFIQKYDDCPFKAIYQYSLLNVEEKNSNTLVMQRSYLVDSFTNSFYLPLLKAAECQMSVELLCHSQDSKPSLLLSNPDIEDCLRIGLEGHAKVSFVEAFAYTDKNKLKVKSSCSVEHVYSGPDPKSFFKKVPTETEKSFQLEGVNGYFELQPSMVSRFFKRLNGRSLLLCEFVTNYEFVGNEKSQALYEVYHLKLDKIEASNDPCIVDETKHLPKYLILSDGDVMELRRNPRLLRYPEFSDEYSYKYSEVLLFGKLEAEEDLTRESVPVMFEELVENSQETKIKRNKRSFLRKMRLSRL